jgi:hypothetical protein
MDKTNRFSLMIDALTALAEEEQTQTTSHPPEPGLPALSSVLADSSPLPHTALFLGMAEDGLPILLDLYDPVPGPILIVADESSGKTAFLQMVARATEAMHEPADVRSAIITPRTDEWKIFQDSPSMVGVYPAQSDSARELLQSLVEWAHNNREKQQTILLLIDDLEAIIKLGKEAEQSLRWLLLRGPSRSVWPIITLNASRARSMEVWLEFFRTRLFGSTRDEETSNFITGDSGKFFNDLEASQFTMREGKNWLKFWSPAID